VTHVLLPTAGEFSALSEDNDSVDHRLQLFLDMEVFEEEEEELQSFLKVGTTLGDYAAYGPESRRVGTPARHTFSTIYGKWIAFI